MPSGTRAAPLRVTGNAVHTMDCQVATTTRRLLRSCLKITRGFDVQRWEQMYNTLQRSTLDKELRRNAHIPLVPSRRECALII